MTTQKTEDEVLEAFLSTPEAEAYTGFIQEARTAMEHGAVMVEVPAALLSLLLPDLAADIMHFIPMRDIYNRVCDEQGRPDMKKKPRQSPIFEDVQTDESEEEPF